MKLRLFYILFVTLNYNVFSQIDASALLGLPRVPNIASITGETADTIGNVVYNDADNKIYRYDGTNWIADAGTDDQRDDEVPLQTPIDVNNVAGDPNAGNETNVQQVIQAITPITSKNGRVFYPPSIQIDVSTNGTGRTLNLYQEYINQHTGAGIIKSTIGGTAAPNIPVYAVDELYYYVTFADPAVFTNISINGTTGIMTYDVIGQPADFNSLINVVFVVK